MNALPQIRRSGVRGRCLLLLVLLAGGMPLLLAQRPKALPPNGPAQAVLLSDTHFDPFRDPSKAKRLVAAPEAEWPAILGEAPAADAAQQFDALQAACSEKGVDATNDLLLSSFAAGAGASQHTAFVLVGGDLLVHRIDCRYHKLIDPSGKDAAGLAAFEAKVVRYELSALRQRFPTTPVYAALGNNDTGCEDYAMDENSDYLRSLTGSFAAGWTQASAADRLQASRDFAHFASYSLPLPAPIARGRVIVLNDTYLSTSFRGTCTHAPSAAGEDLLRWLRVQLEQARQHRENVWLLGHIPPDVNTYATYQKPHNICHGQPPEMFLRDAGLNDLIAEYSDVVRLFVSGHTHVDESHLLESGTTAKTPLAVKVPLKTIPSVTPISNNPPAFLTAQVDLQTAAMADYQLHFASSTTGTSIAWRTVYDFREAYSEKAFDAASLSHLFERFERNDPADEAAIATYGNGIARGLRLLAFQISFPQQVCALQHSGAEEFTRCACAAKGGLLPPAE